MPFNWNQQAEAKLISLILQAHDLKLDYPSLSAALGGGLTPMAVRQHIIKLKKAGMENMPDDVPGVTVVMCPTTDVAKRGNGKKGGKIGKGGKGGVKGAGVAKASPRKKRRMSFAEQEWHDNQEELRARGVKVGLMDDEFTNTADVDNEQEYQYYDGEEDEFALLREAAGLVVAQ